MLKLSTFSMILGISLFAQSGAFAQTSSLISNYDDCKFVGNCGGYNAHVVVTPAQLPCPEAKEKYQVALKKYNDVSDKYKQGTPEDQSKLRDTVNYHYNVAALLYQTAHKVCYHYDQ